LARSIREVGIAFLFAPLYHPALRHAAAPRGQLGVPTFFNFLGPVANPARPAAQAVGVADPRIGPILAGVLAGRGCSALVFRGEAPKRAVHDGLHEPVAFAVHVRRAKKRFLRFERSSHSR
jgi:anthranilate phosphoribosyltransferase